MGPLASLLLVAQGSAPFDRDWTRATFAATPVCAAGHGECRGSATLAISSEHGALEIDRREVRAGERFELAADDDLATFLCELEVSVELEVLVELGGHAPAVLADIPGRRGPRDVGTWRIPVEPAAPRAIPSTAPPLGTEGALRVELVGGDPDEVIASVAESFGWACTVDELPRRFSLSTPGIRRIAPREWELDLARLGIGAEDALTLRTTRGRMLEREDALPGEERVVRLVVPDPSPERWIRGRLTSSTGSVAGVTVESYDSPSRAVSKHDGTFELGPLVSGTHALFVHGARWTSTERPHLEVDVTRGDRADVELFLAPQRRITVDARAIELAEAPGAVLIVRSDPWMPAMSLALSREQLREPFDVPAPFGAELELVLVPIPAGGFDLPASWTDWIASRRDEPRIARFRELRRASVRF